MAVLEFVFQKTFIDFKLSMLHFQLYVDDVIFLTRGRNWRSKEIEKIVHPRKVDIAKDGMKCDVLNAIISKDTAVIAFDLMITLPHLKVVKVTFSTKGNSGRTASVLV